jgi:hypothetical protein
MMRFLLGFITAIVLLVVAAGAYLRLGLAPVATSAPPLPFERLVTSTALHARIDKEAPVSVPINVTREAYMAGAHTYRTHCAVCHGLPGKNRQPSRRASFQSRRHLEGKGVTDDPPGSMLEGRQRYPPDWDA